MTTDLNVAVGRSSGGAASHRAGPGQRSAHFVVVVLVTLALVTSLATTLLFATIGDAGPILLALAAAAPVLLMVPSAVLRRQFDTFEPINFVLLSILIGVTGRTFLLVLTDNAAIRHFLLLGHPISILLPGMLVMLGGLACFSAGYAVRVPRLPLHRVRALRVPEFNRRRLALVAVPVVVISVVSLVAFLSQTGALAGIVAGAVSTKLRVGVQGGQYAYSALGYYRLGAGLAVFLYCCVLATSWSGRRRRSRSWTLLTVGLGMLGIVLPFLASSRTGALLIIVVTALIVHYGRRPLPFRHVMAIGMLGLGAFVLMGVLRERARLGVVDVGAGVAGAFEETLGTRHWLGIDKTSLVVDAVPRAMPYAWGGTLFIWAVAPIPRSLWPGKPLVRVGPIIGEYIYGVTDWKTGIPPGLVAEFYWNFGLLGVFCGMFLLGVLLRLLYRSFEPLLKARRPGAIVLYTVCVAPVALQMPGTDVSGGVIGLLAAGIPTIILLTLIASRPARRPAISRPAIPSASL